MTDEVRKAIGRITLPKSGASIERSTYVEGELFDLPMNNCHIWLFLEKQHGTSSRLWPKSGELPLTEGKFSHRFEEHGASSQNDFSILLLQVNDDIQRLIENWRRYGRMVGSYPGLFWRNLVDDNNINPYVLDRIDRLKLRRE